MDGTLGLFGDQQTSPATTAISETRIPGEVLEPHVAASPDPAPGQKGKRRQRFAASMPAKQKRPVRSTPSDTQPEATNTISLDDALFATLQAHRQDLEGTADRSNVAMAKFATTVAVASLRVGAGNKELLETLAKRFRQSNPKLKDLDVTEADIADPCGFFPRCVLSGEVHKARRTSVRAAARALAAEFGPEAKENPRFLDASTSHTMIVQ